MQNIYCISGLGVDERLFRKIEVPGFQLVHLPWVVYDKHDTIKTYAAKMMAGISDENPIIMGVSFGGMIATEIAEMVNAKHVILLSSSKTKNELPLLYRIVGKSGLLHIAPIWLVKRVFFILYFVFGIKTKEDKKLLRSILKDTSNSFVRWSTIALTHWERTSYPNSITHIHGTSDKILYPFCVKPDYWIKNGGHLIILQNYQDVNNILDGILNKPIG